MRKVDKPWGYEMIWAVTKNYAGKILHIENGFSLSLQYHNIKEETVMVKSGILTLEIGEADNKQVLRLAEGEVYHIPPKLVHRMSAADGPVEVIEVSTAELGDVVRLQDNYGRL